MSLKPCLASYSALRRTATTEDVRERPGPPPSIRDLRGIGGICHIPRMTRPADSLPFFFESPGPTFSIEAALMRDGHRRVVGLDEVGRGPLAGPVVACAVILDPSRIPMGLNDSKQLSLSERERLYAEILASADVAIASVSARGIDLSDIRKASLEAMRRAALSLARAPDFAIIDGRDVPPGLPCPAKAFVKGDGRSVTIAAASIVAKVTRDLMMTEASVAYPGYGFEKHSGYATAQHRVAIETLGPCPLHRMSFRPLRKD
ncbi:ribonuclease HII [Rhizobium sp. SG_E_25_P2]|nr:ribonuclease HII [Rhizobium sp. SG_E_25_P2]